MIFGAHVLLYSKDADADRAFLSALLPGGVDAGAGWLILPLPPAEVAVHPAEEQVTHELYLMSDDLEREIPRMRALGASVSDVRHASWGSLADLSLPGGGRIGLYQPRHSLAIPAPPSA